jgi:hypothetical protein
MIIGRKSCSRTRSQWGRPCSLRLGEANARAVASRELGSASLRKVGVASLPNEVKPAPEGEATTASTRRTPRGGRRQRAQKEPAGTWETRFGVFSGQPLTGSHNRRRGRIAGWRFAVADHPLTRDCRRIKGGSLLSGFGQNRFDAPGGDLYISRPCYASGDSRVAQW